MGNEEGKILIWNILTKKKKSKHHIITQHKAEIRALLQVDSSVWSGDVAGLIYIWNTRSFTCIGNISLPTPIFCFSLVPEATTNAVWVGSSGDIIVIDPKTRKPVTSWNAHKGSGIFINKIVFVPDSDMVWWIEHY